MEDEAEDRLMLRRALRCFFGGAVSAVLAAVGMLLWQRGPYNEMDPDKKTGGLTYTATDLTGLLLFNTFAALDVVLLNVASTTYLRYAVGYCDSKAAIAAAFAIHCVLALCYFVTGFVAAVLWARDPLKCGVIFCINKPPQTTRMKGVNAAIATNANISMMALFTLCPLALVMWGRAIISWLQIRGVWGEARAPGANRLQGRGVDGGGWALTTHMRMFHAPRAWRRLVVVIALLIALCFFATISFYLPNRSTWFISALISSSAAERVKAGGGAITVPELPHAVFRTREMRVTDGLYLKIFPSNAFFYGYLMVLLVLIWALRLTQGGRYWLSRRMVLLPAWSLSEGVVLVLTVVMCVLFFFYWVHDHNFIQTWQEGKPVKGYMGAAEVWGRALGQLALLFLSLLMFPISRRSVLFTLLGLSWDSFMWFHRVMGYAMLFATLGHIIAFFVQYHEQGVLLYNMNKLPNIVGQNRIIYDFTVNVVTWATWLTLVSMGLLALHWVRRHYFELFYYSHLVAAYALFPAVLWHAAAGWEYMLPGLTLWFVDRLIRLFQSSALVTVRHAYAVSEDVVEIAFTVGMWGCNSVHPGHYVFVNVPEISPLQWHPFTVSSAVPAKKDVGGSGASSDAYLLSSPTTAPDLVANEDSNVLTVHVKSMGRGTWSGRLYRHVTLGRPLTLCVDGPCGTPIDFSLYDDIYFVCGGIGVTPCASIFGSLVRQQLLTAEYGVCRPRRVRLVWVTRSAALVGAMAGTLCLPAHLRQLAHSPAARDQAGRRNVSGNDASQHDGQPATREGDIEMSSDACSVREGQTDNPEEGAPEDVSRGVSHDISDKTSMLAIRQYFECHVFITNKQSYREYQACEELFYRNDAKLCLSRREGAEVEETEVGAYAIPSAGLAGGDGLVTLQVASGRPGLADEVNPELISGVRVPELPFNVQRTIVFVCGPERLVEQTAHICAGLKLTLHKENFSL